MCPPLQLVLVQSARHVTNGCESQANDDADVDDDLLPRPRRRSSTDERTCLEAWVAARQALDRGDISGALDCLKAVPKPVPAKIHFNRASLLCKLGCVDEAIAVLDAALEQDPYFSLAFARRGELWFQAGQHERAANDFDRCLQSFRGQAINYTQLGLKFVLNKQDVQHNLALTYWQLGLGERAARIFAGCGVDNVLVEIGNVLFYPTRLKAQALVPRNYLRKPTVCTVGLPPRISPGSSANRAHRRGATRRPTLKALGIGVWRRGSSVAAVTLDEQEAVVVAGPAIAVVAAATAERVPTAKPASAPVPTNSPERSLPTPCTVRQAWQDVQEGGVGLVVSRHQQQGLAERKQQPPQPRQRQTLLENELIEGQFAAVMQVLAVAASGDGKDTVATGAVRGAEPCVVGKQRPERVRAENLSLGALGTEAHPTRAADAGVSEPSRRHHTGKLRHAWGSATAAKRRLVRRLRAMLGLSF